MPMTSIEAAKRGAKTAPSKPGAGAQATRKSSGQPQSSKQVAVPAKK